MPKQTVSTRVNGNTKTQIEQRAESEDETESDSARYYLQKGIEADRAATDGGQVNHRFTFVELLTIAVLTATVMMWVFTGAAGPAYLKWAMGMTAASALLLTVYFGQVVFNTAAEDGEVASR